MLTCNEQLILPRAIYENALICSLIETRKFHKRYFGENLKQNRCHKSRTEH